MEGDAPMKKSILFVDDQPEVLRGLRRTLFEFADEWQMEFVEGGATALAVLKDKSFDVLVTDMRMPGMDGNELLAKVAEQFPSVIRIVLSGDSEVYVAMKSLGAAHQFLAKPLEQDKLRAILDRAFGLRNILGDQRLQTLAADLKSLPSLPTLYQDLMQVMQAPDAKLQQAGEIIARDVGMTARLMQIVNSSFFGLPVRVADPAHAAKLLGLDILKGLVLSVQLFSKFEQITVEGFSIQDFTQHSIRVASSAKRIAQHESCEKSVAEDAFLAGMLHDVGKLVLAQNMPEGFAEVLSLAAEQGIPAWQVEESVLGATHASVGAYLLGIWGLADPLLEAVAYHHSPQAAPGSSFNATPAVYVANEFCQSSKMPDSYGNDNMDQYLAQLDLVHKKQEWQEVVWEVEARGEAQ